MNMIIDGNQPYFDWPDWIQFHSTFYGWDQERELKMLLAWSTYFAGEGYGPEELLAASKDLTGVKIFKREETIYELEKALRIRRDNYRRTVKPEVADCSMCRGTGLVLVPFLAHVKDGIWTSKIKCWVSCICLNSLPFKTTASGEGKKSVMTLEIYELRNPNWMRHMAQAEESERNLAKTINDLTPNSNKELNEIIDRIAKRFKAPEEEPPRMIVDASVRTYG